MEQERPLMTSNATKEYCPKCHSIEVDAMTPRTKYACGSSDYDKRPNTFTQSEECKKASQINQNKMKDNKEQTVVQQIVQALDIECKSRGMNVNWDMYLEMEKKQIEKAWDEGDVNIKLFYCGEQYYKETYGK